MFTLLISLALSQPGVNDPTTTNEPAIEEVSLETADDPTPNADVVKTNAISPTTTAVTPTPLVEPATTTPVVAAEPEAPAPTIQAIDETKQPPKATTPSEVYDGGLKWTFGANKQNSLRLITWHQIWARYNHANPNTLVNGESKEHQVDVGLRRSRMVFLVNFTDRFTLMAHFGINNQSFVSARKPQLYIHDAWTQFRVWKEYLYIGAGLHIWSGISRLTSASTLTLMTIDIPIVNAPTVDRSDQFGRHLGVYAKGQIGKIDYRVSVNQPFAVTDDDGEIPVGSTEFNPTAKSINVAGYAMWEFLDNESNVLPYYAGTYLGTKRVFNLGFGFQYQPEGMRDQTEDGRVREHDIVLLGADAFLDLPMKNQNGAITAYAVYYYYDFGPNYLRNIGILNTGTAAPGSPNPGGNAYPIIGTGHHAYGQVGYLLPWQRMGLHRVQPYATAQVSFFEALDQPTVVPEAGINWYMLGHHTKLTLAYRNRPVYGAPDENGDTKVSTRRSEAILQAQMFF